MLIVDLIALLAFVVCIYLLIRDRITGSDSISDTGCGFLVIITIFGLFFSFCSFPRYKEWRSEGQVRDAHAQMMESCFNAAPQLRTTLNNLQAEIDKWQGNKEKFTRMRDASQTAGGRALAEEKLARIEQVLNGLMDSHNSVLEQVEMIAMESEGQFTELDRRSLEDLGRRVEDSVRHARELREGLSGG